MDEDSGTDRAEPQAISLLSIINDLLAKERRSHMLSIVILAPLLYGMGKSGVLSPASCAIAFISLMAGYCITALLALDERTKPWIQKVYAASDETGQDRNLLQRLRSNALHTLRILLVPLAAAAILFLLLNALILEGGPLESVGAVLPIALACLFIFWSVSQALSFRDSVGGWIKNRIGERRTPAAGSVIRTAVIQIAAVAVVAALVSLAVLSMLGEGGLNGPNGVFIVVPLIALTQGGVLWYNRTVRADLIASEDGAQYDLLWGITLHGFAAWHLLSVYRRLVSAEDSGFDLLEEIVLMVFTVVMSIWAMSSRGMYRNYRFFTSETMLFWGLAFGFGYAGSVTMLAVGIEGDLKSIFAVGHLVTWLTLMLMHRSTCKDFLTSANRAVPDPT